jgi:hypothetical protein
MLENLQHHSWQNTAHANDFFYKKIALCGRFRPMQITACDVFAAALSPCK